MAKPASKVSTDVKKSDRRWQSDIIVDMIKRYGFEYIALNPGASYRGLHDSLVNSTKRSLYRSLMAMRAPPASR
jgi:acetolactate synthase-1/2/3 large subunit